MANLVGRTHDPLTGEMGVRIDPPEHPQAKALAQLLSDLPLTDAVEARVADGADKAQIVPMARSARAAIRIAAELLRFGSIKPEDAVSRIQMTQFMSLLGKRISANSSGLTKVGYGLGASTGAGCGLIATSAETAVNLAETGKPVVLLVEKTTPEDMAALKAVQAIVTTIGGFTSHAAVVARQMGKPCIVDAKFSGGLPIAGTSVTVDGSSGNVFLGEATFEEGKLDDDMIAILKAADLSAKMDVFANADTAEDVAVALTNGAKGVGLCRTEHTFFTVTGTAAMRALILAETETQKKAAIQTIEQLQREHFRTFFNALGKHPATIRLLDPPLHEFLPSIEDKKAVAAMAKNSGLAQKRVLERMTRLHEENPMLGHRGCRLAITIEGLYEAQARAIVLAASDVKHEGEIGIMIPLIVDAKELKAVLTGVKKTTQDAMYSLPDYACPTITFGAMLETPRACILAKELAVECDFFSFGTNDLTQATWALSRDDSTKFMEEYNTKGIFTDPFITLDFDGVGALMSHAVTSIGAKRSEMKIGICGEHGGDPTSIAFCHGLGLNYVSCAPPRILGARLAASHINLKTPIFVPLELSLPKTVEVTPIPKTPATVDWNAWTKPFEPVKPVELSPVLVSGTLKAPKGSKPIKIATSGKVKMIADEHALPNWAQSGLGVLEIDHAAIPKITVSAKPTDKPPSWLKNAKLATPAQVEQALQSMTTTSKKDAVLSLSQVAKKLSGLQVGVKTTNGAAPASGVVVGSVGTPYSHLIVLAVEDPLLGSEPQELNALVEWQIHCGKSTKIWLAFVQDLVPLPQLVQSDPLPVAEIK